MDITMRRVYENGRYLFTDVLGKGGTSTVYLALDTHLKMNRAVKVIKKCKGLDEVVKKEIEMLKMIEYPSIPRIIDYCQDDENFAIICEYVPGINLKEMIEDKPFNLKRSVDIMKKVCDALIYLHNNDPSILYLDLKPSNIMFLKSKEVKLIDFGVSAYMLADSKVYGTIGYAPKEQMEYDSKHPPDIRSDIYSLGMTYLSIRTGYCPGASREATIKYIHSSKRLKKKEKQFINKCIKEEPAERFKTVLEAKESLIHIEKISVPGKHRVFIPVFIILIILIISVFLKFSYEQYDKDKNAKEMIRLSSSCIENGEYTLRGVRIIEGYITSMRLEESVREQYAFEAARTYFTVYTDYERAKNLFEILDKDEYPEAEYYIRLCDIVRDFNSDDSDIKECLKYLTGITINSSSKESKYENLLFIASCYEWFLSDKTEGFKYAGGVLETGLCEIKKEKWDEELISEMEGKFEKRIDDLKEKQKKIMKGVKGTKEYEDVSL